MPHPPTRFRFAIDRGGTFTDVYAEFDAEPGFMALKLLSEDPDNYPDAPREGIRRVLVATGALAADAEEIDGRLIEEIRMGTTVATNALLERKGAPCALLVTRGLGDALRIGDQSRPQLFDLRARRPEPLHREVEEVDERIRLLRPGATPRGEVVTGVSGERFEILRPLDSEALRPRLAALRERGIEALAVVFMHAYAWPGHERRVGALARELGFTQISLSSEVMPRTRLLPRADTTLVDAYLTPAIRAYVQGFRRGFSDHLKDTRLWFMQSDGGLAGADDFSGSRAILSGPAGGVVGYARTTREHCGDRPLIGFDMGGTSTDVSRYGGDLELAFENQIAGVRIQAPQLDIRTVAAGGGSRLFFQDGLFLVGPESAGAHPGPVCYRKGGHLALTDANLVLGRIQPDFFPAIFGPGEDQPLDLEAARAAFAAITAEVNRHYARQGRPRLSIEAVALGFVEVANEVMVRPIREVSALRGFDAAEHVLATFGGAGPQHACAVARSLGMRRVFIHRFAPILSAYGLGLAEVVQEAQRPAAGVYRAGDVGDLRRGLDDLAGECVRALEARGFGPGSVEVQRYLNLRYQGTDTQLMVEEPPDGDFAARFLARHEREFGFVLPDRPIQVDDLRVRALGRAPGLARSPLPDGRPPARPLARRPVTFSQGTLDTPLYALDALAPGQCVPGPALIVQEGTSILVEPGCTARLDPYGDLEIEVGAPPRAHGDTRVDPVRLSVFGNLFMSIAEQMGRRLQKTALSTNIKERLDFSCALFDPAGRLVANAPHVPVHLGAMSEAVQAQIRLHPDIAPGDVLMSNHPAAGGSHLPDITVVTPVFDADRIIFWVANRGHHADVGGISPGSMPPHSRRLSEEGVAVESFKLVRAGRFQDGALLELLTHPPEGGPARRPADNLSDLAAQVAANRRGVEGVLEMVDKHGLDVVQAYMGHVQAAAEAAVRERLRDLAARHHLGPGDAIEAEDRLDDGSLIRLRLAIDPQTGDALFDFSGTGPEIWGNLNAPPAVTRSAILYCLRCLIERDLPLNQGCLVPIRIHLPPGSLLAPAPEAAVVGGNVLTSQRVVDVVLKAFGVAAASQGCMNNLSFGDRRFGYYETIGGGAGAGPGWDGQSGVHTHMTNTRITDAETLERRYPVLVREFSLRRGSGGAGHWRGGDGLIREIEFLEPMEVSILSERRVFAPYGMAGGGPGATGCNLAIRRDGRVLYLGGKGRIRLEAGERVRILTPGGGGWGAPPADPTSP